MAIFSRDYIGRIIITEGWYEKLYLEEFSKRIFPTINRESIALDLGANVGNHSLWFANYFSQVHSFEPNERTFLLLKANSLIATNIYVHNVGCSNKKAVNQLARIPYENIGGSNLQQHSNIDEEGDTSYFDLIRLDDYLPKELHKKVGFIKCDVEGLEEEALRGAEKIIVASKPVIAFEVNDFEGVWEFLSSIGYSNFYGFKLINKYYVSKVIKFMPITKNSASQVSKVLVIASTNVIKN